MSWLKKNLSLLIILVITVIYLWLIFYITDLASFKKLELNEMGDFLAGGFAPLAFLWLVFGYLQQGEELKQNTEALKLQAQELKNSVEQQKELVTIQKQEAEAKHFSVQPILKYKLGLINLDHRQDYVYDDQHEPIDINGDPYFELHISFEIDCQINSAHRIKIINTLDNSIEDQIIKINQDKSATVSFCLIEDQIENILKDNEFNVVLYVEYFDVYGKSFNEKIRIDIYQFDWSLKYAQAQLKVLNN